MKRRLIQTDCAVKTMVYCWFIVSCTYGSRWESTGTPYGLPVQSLAVSEESWAAIASIGGTSGVARVHTSRSNGRTWTSSVELNGSRAVAIAGGSTLILGGEDGTTLRSSDGGRNWERLACSLPARISRARSVGRVVLAETGRAVYRSTDLGATWVQVLEYGSEPEPSVLSVGGDGRMFTSFTTAERKLVVQMSIDTGANWTAIPYGQGAETIGPTRLLFAQQGHLFASGSGKLFRSGMKRLEWSEIARSDHLPIRMVDVLSVGRSILCATAADYGIPSKLLRSDDSGATWVRIDGQAVTRSEIKRLESAGGMIAAATTIGVWSSRDTGKTWTSLNDGMSDESFGAIVGSGQALCVGGRTISVSGDAGKAWSSPFVDRQFYVAAMSRASHQLYAFAPFQSASPSMICESDGAYDCTNRAGGVYRSTNQGLSWSRLSGSYMPPHKVHGVATPDTQTFIAASDAGMFRSHDNCQTWVSANAGLSDTATVAVAQWRGRLYCATREAGIYISDDRAGSWQPLNSARIHRSDPEDSITCLAVDSSCIFAGTRNGVYASIDNGASWAPISDDLPSPGVTSIWADSAVLYVIVDHRMVFSRKRSEFAALSSGNARNGHSPEFRSAGTGSASYFLSEESAVTIDIHDLNGRLVYRERRSSGAPGQYTFQFPRRLPSGVCILTIRGQSATGNTKALQTVLSR